MTTRSKRTSAAFATIAALALTGAPAALAATPRADPYYEIWCVTDDGTRYLAKIVDARAIQLQKEPGGKDTATARFNERNPFGETCAELGPFGRA